MQTHIDFTGLTALFDRAAGQGRDYLFEYEVYEFIRLIGGETPPQFFLLAKDERFDGRLLDKLPGEKVVIKVVSPYILHKSDVGGVRIVRKNNDEVLSTLRRMSCEIPEKYAEIILRRPEEAPARYRGLAAEEVQESVAADIRGYILCQYMRPDSEEFGNELLVSLRNTREFGLILSAGLGGRDTELYAARFKKGQAVVSASTEQVDGAAFFALFKNTISYKKLAGLTRGQKRIVTDDQLLECFAALIQVAQYFSPLNTAAPYVIEELEVNPFAFSNYLMMPLDGLCRFSTERRIQPPRPIAKIEKMLHPASIGIVGISARKTNIGRIILQNILANGFPRQDLSLIHPTAKEIDGIPTLSELSALPQKLDLLILAVDGAQVPNMIDNILQNNLADSVLLIAGGLGEQEGQQHLILEIQQKIVAARRHSEEAPIFLGANSLGILSHPGRYDAMFIPDSKLPKNRGDHRRTLGLVSQSGAYMITRMSKLNFLDPAYAVSIGNQLDLTAGDFLHYLNGVDELQTLAFYMEGFADLDGLSFARAIREAIPRGKEVIFYKAGRTPEGKNALSGHTASIAGDYMVCESCIGQAGAMVAETFNVFEGLLRLACALHKKSILGNRLAAISNAGYEAVGIADNLLGEDYRLEIADLSNETHTRLQTILAGAGLTTLAAVHNPLDITPMASEDVYVEVIETLLVDKGIDAVIVAIVPLTPILHTLAEELAPNHFHREKSIVERIARLSDVSPKPLVVVVDSGSLYDYLADAFQTHGLPVFRSADIAVSVLGKYIQNSLRNRTAAKAGRLPR
ncbi:MAG: CoA-binding protein [Desulfobacterales bacterium GWB2_56_26]|nr:MAG: CoA-binding protein [Desulfobacterales bacterium GWB2_56_26]